MIKKFDKGLYTFDIPNKEVRTGLMEDLTQYCVPVEMANQTI